MLATKKLYDENSGSPQRSEKVPLTQKSQCLTIQDLPPPPLLRMSRKHRPTPLDLSPKRQHLSPLDSNNPNALEEYLFSNSHATANSSVGLGMPSPAHYSQIDLFNILETNPPLTPVAPLRTAPVAPEVDVVPVSPGFPPALHAEDTEGPIDEIFLELLHTETSFLSEIETIEAMVKEVLCPLGVVGSDWVSGVSSLRILHAGFAKELGKSDSGAITPTLLQSLLEWVLSLLGHSDKFSLNLPNLHMRRTSLLSDWNWTANSKNSPQKKMLRNLQKSRHTLSLKVENKLR